MFRTLPVERIQHSLSADWGLDAAGIAARMEQYGPNDVIEKPPRAWLSLVMDTLVDPMIWFLVGASVLFIFLQKYSSAAILLFAIIPIGGMDAYLHWRTQISTQSLSKRISPQARVMRNQQYCTIDARDIVPGDLLWVKAGEYFPADGIIVAAENCQVDESSLTGETYPVVKQPLTQFPNPSAEPLIDYRHWGFVGTRVLTGHAIVRVVFTGKATLYGEIVESAFKSQHEKTPLQHALARLILILIVVSTAFCILLAIIRYQQGFGLIDALLSAATLAVVALPDEFPMTFTFFLGVGVYRLAKKHALVKRAVSVENIGRITHICTDKTGTLTEGRFQIANCYPAERMTDLDLLVCAQAASRVESGDPLDLAIQSYTEKLNVNPFTSLHVFPFTEERKRETAIYQTNSHYSAATKGAPETIFNLCNLTNEQRDAWHNQVNAYATQGYKVLACARYDFSDKPDSMAEPTHGYALLGLLAFEDPPRPEVYAAVKACQKSGIRVLMITGDHPATAKKIAMDIGLGGEHPNVMLASEVEVLLMQQEREFLQGVDVIARAIPSQKLNIVTALHDLNDIVAVTGDGVNDVPALRAADVGIAMGERGTQSAREAASIVLLDDNFGSIVNAIQEGKQLFKNLQLSFKYLLMVHTPYVISATLVPLLGFPLLYYPIHIVCIELLIHPTCMLVFQNLPTQSSIDSPPMRQRRLTFFSSNDWMWLTIIGIYSSLVVMGAYFMSLKLTGSDEFARANAILAVVLAHVAFTAGLSHMKTRISWVIISFSMILILLLVQIPVVAHYFNMQPPSLWAWCILIALNVITYGFTRKLS